MWALEEIRRLNEREVQRIESKPRWTRYGVTGDVQSGLHLRCQQRLLTFYIEPGEPAQRFLHRLEQLQTESERERFIVGHFPE
jgi:hypothetical protein